MGLPESRTPGLKQQLHQGCNGNCVRDKQEAGVRDLQKGDTTSQKPLAAVGKVSYENSSRWFLFRFLSLDTFSGTCK